MLFLGEKYLGQSSGSRQVVYRSWHPDFGRISIQLGLEGPDEAQDLESSKEIHQGLADQIEE